MDRISRRGLIAGGAAAVAAVPAAGALLGSTTDDGPGAQGRGRQAVAICGPVPPNLDSLSSGIAARIPKFADLGAEFGIDGNRIVEAVRASGPEQSPAEPGWVPTMTAIGDEALARAEATRRAAKARDRFMEASFWYFLARFPQVFSPAGGEAYDKHVSAYLDAARYFDPPLEEVQVPFAGGSYPAYLRLPRGDGRDRGPWPAVVVWGGMDIWKSDLEVHLETEALLDLGIATLAIDAPGTGQSPIPLSTDSERVPIAAVEFLRGRRAIDADRIAVWGLSLGGYFAVKLALMHPELAGAVNNGGHVHYGWAPERLEQIPEGAVITLAKTLGLELDSELSVIAEHIAGLSLVHQGLLPADRYAPLLSINGELDELVPISDLHVIGEYGVRQDRMIYGEDGHVAGRNWRQHQRLAATWLATKLMCGAAS